MKPSILHVITTIDRGGAENHLLELARAQVKTGHKVTVAYLKGAAEQKENFQSAGVEVIQGGKSFFAQFAKIHKLARSGLYPIVHAHLPQAELACLGVPNHIISRHNTEPFVPGVPAFLSSYVARLCTYRSTVIAISDAVKNYTIENSMIASRIPISVVYYGINHQDFQLHDFDSARWRQQELNCEPEDFVFGTISRLVPQKDLQTLINAFSKISKEGRSKLVIVGDGVQKNELEKLVRSLNLENMVQFLGKRRDIPEFLHAIDAFALTSKYEGLGLVLLEALASEVPIIAARNSAIKEIVNDEVALMFETSSVSGLEKAMRDLINDPNETSHRVQRGNVRVQQKFGIDSMLKQVANIYTHILKDGLK